MKRNIKIGDRIYFEYFGGGIGSAIVRGIRPDITTDDYDKPIHFNWLTTGENEHIEDYNTLAPSNPKVKAYIKGMKAKREALINEALMFAYPDGIIMKPFNLEEYLKNPSMKVVTRNGRNARIICTNKKSKFYPIVALIDYESIENVYKYTKEGKINTDDSNSADLFFAPEKHEGWINIYRVYASGNMSAGHIFDTEEEAKHNADIDDIATVKIEWEE